MTENRKISKKPVPELNVRESKQPILGDGVDDITRAERVKLFEDKEGIDRNHINNQ